MRLIDADALIEEIRNGDKVASFNYFLSLVQAQPTAYDIEKVVEQIDEYITKIVGRKSALYQTIMRIVRKGGVE